MEPLAAALPSTVRTILRKGPMSEGKFQLAWRVAVGPAIDRATRASLRADGTVDVRASDVAWRREVRRSQAVILDRLRDLVGPSVISGMKVAVRVGKD
jgi:predicted nucleic acid-binding Zn ribbon protein